MIEGFFKEGGRPFFSARLFIPAIDVLFRLDLLLDTGSDTTVLMPQEGGAVGLKYNMLRRATTLSGIGGDAAAFVERAMVVLTDAERRQHVFEISLLIVPPSPEADRLPSLLGRDVANRLAITYDATGGVLEAGVRSADYTVPAGAS